MAVWYPEPLHIRNSYISPRHLHHTHLHGPQLVQEANKVLIEENLASMVVSKKKETVVTERDRYKS